MRRQIGGVALVLAGIAAAGPARAQGASKATTVVVSVAPEWGYRAFVDSEPNSRDKTYNASGILGLGARAEFYPLAPLRAPLPSVARDFGIIGTYSRAFGLTSTDIDTSPAVVMDNNWYHYLVGLRFRALGGSNPLAIGFTAAFERWVFDFDIPDTKQLVVPTASYSLLPLGADARLSVGRFSFFADARFLFVLSKGSFGQRVPTGGMGLHADVGAAFTIVPKVEVDARASYTLVRFDIPSVPGRHDPAGMLFDHYLVFSLGGTVRF